MNIDFYKQVIDELPIGYAYQKIICDEAGIPCDYEFIEVNAAFEKLTGLKGSDIVGRKVTEVLPDIKKSKFDWISFCGEIAIVTNGEKTEVEQFSECLQRFYKITIYSPEKYYFITHFIDITKDKSQLSGMEKLVDVSEEFLQINEQNIRYQKISDDFLKMCGAKYAAFNLFDEDGKNYITMAISADKGVLKRASDIFGFNLEGKKWGYNTATDKKIKARTITRFDSLKELLEDIIPSPLALIIGKTFNIGEVILIKIVKKNIMIGNFTLCMEKGKKFDKDALAKVYTRQLGMLITRRRAEEELRHEKILTDAIFQSAPGMIYLYNDEKKLVRWNKKHESVTGYSSEELSKISIFDWFKKDKKSQKAVIDGLSNALEVGFADAEADLQKKDGTTMPMYFTASALYLDGKQYFAGIGIDITERKKKEAEIFYLSYHDQLTGLYNRRFYEEELKRIDTRRNLPMTIVMGDVNGLKLINDSFGHVMGDNLLKKVAEVITKGCRVDDIIARLAGDEFVIILPKTDAFETKQIIKRIMEFAAIEKVGSVDISISFGYGTKNSVEEEIEEIFKIAEDHMYEKKLFDSQSMRGKTIKSIISALHEKNKSEEQHSLRVARLCERMAEALGMSENEKEELKSVGLLHDIGKIAIDENILNKPGKLTEDEKEEISHHPEIGYRMLNTVNDMSGIAKYVLHHHERWDGTGYPKGLKGNDIPFVSRIVHLVDAYDTMTSHKDHKASLTKQVAIEELRKNAGVQFDPELVSIFIEKVLHRKL